MKAGEINSYHLILSMNIYCLSMNDNSTSNIGTSENGSLFGKEFS
jgi:hypothetical protein